MEKRESPPTDRVQTDARGGRCAGNSTREGRGSSLAWSVFRRGIETARRVVLVAVRAASRGAAAPVPRTGPPATYNSYSYTTAHLQTSIC